MMSNSLGYSLHMCMCIYIYHRHHHVVLVAQISLTLYRHFSLSFITSGRSSGLHPVSSHSCWMYVCAGRPAFARPCVGVHRSTSLMRTANDKTKILYKFGYFLFIFWRYSKTMKGQHYCHPFIVLLYLQK